MADIADYTRNCINSVIHRQFTKICEKAPEKSRNLCLTRPDVYSIIPTCKAQSLYRCYFYISERRFIVAKNYDTAILMDFYGEMLTEKQRSFLEYYYNDDLSLSEIAENEGITRQGVRDAIKRAEAQMIEMEERLGVAKRFSEMNDGLKEIIDYSNKITEYNLHHGLSKEINDYSVGIKAAAITLLEG